MNEKQGRIEGTHKDLGLAQVCFVPLVAWGPWSNDALAWERWSLGPRTPEVRAALNA